MLQLAIRGHATRGREVITWLEMLGGENRFQRRGDNEYRFYYIDKNDHIQNTLGALGYVLFDLEKFEEKFPYKVGDKVIYEDKIREITKMVWEEQTNTIAYKLDDKLYCNVINALQPYKEETMKEIKSIDLNKLEQQLDEALAKETPESLNKWMNEEMKKGSKLINPKLVGNECVHFPIPPNMKLEVKDGMCYLYRDCGEYKENKCLQELKEYLSHATREELDKTMEKIEIALAPFKVGDKVIVKGYEGMGEDEIICVFKTYDGNIKYKTKNHLDTHYFMEDNLTRVEKSNKEENMRKQTKIVDLNPKLVGERKVKLVIPHDWEIKEENGEIFLQDKRPQYPKTYEECCKVLGFRLGDNIDNLEGYKSNLLEQLQILLICRDAYWKVYGEQMGLDKPWQPDWSIYVHKFCIGTAKDEVIEECVTTGNRIFAFPTEEMRDMFHVNFKDLIEQCKELL